MKLKFKKIKGQGFPISSVGNIILMVIVVAVVGILLFIYVPQLGTFINNFVCNTFGYCGYQDAFSQAAQFAYDRCAIGCASMSDSNYPLLNSLLKSENLPTAMVLFCDNVPSEYKTSSAQKICNGEESNGEGIDAQQYPVNLTGYPGSAQALSKTTVSATCIFPTGKSEVATSGWFNINSPINYLFVDNVQLSDSGSCSLPSGFGGSNYMGGTKFNVNPGNYYLWAYTASLALRTPGYNTFATTGVPYTIFSGPGDETPKMTVYQGVYYRIFVQSLQQDFYVTMSGAGPPAGTTTQITIGIPNNGASTTIQYGINPGGAAQSPITKILTVGNNVFSVTLFNTDLVGPGIILTGTIQVQYDSSLQNEAILFSNTNYGGTSSTNGIGTSIPDLSTINPNLNNAISSVQVGSGTEVILYSNTNYSGNSVTLTSSTPDLSQVSGGCTYSTAPHVEVSNWNDCAQSLRILPT